MRSRSFYLHSISLDFSRVEKEIVFTSHNIERSSHNYMERLKKKKKKKKKKTYMERCQHVVGFILNIVLNSYVSAICLQPVVRNVKSPLIQLY